MAKTNPRFMPRRALGRTGFTATRLGAGDLADRNVPIDQCVATLRRALDAGLNLVDTAPAYEDGYSEEIVGRALEGRRDGIFVIDKIDHLHKPVAEQVDGSLARLRIEHTDLFVFHGVSRLSDWQALVAPGGGFDQLAACVKAGKTRFRGISSHHPDVLKTALDSKLCDVVMFPIGPFVDERYENEILPRCKTEGVGSVCFKTFGAGKLLGDTEGYGRPLAARPRGKVSSGGSDASVATMLARMDVDTCVRYTLTCDPDVALLGLSFPNEQDAAFAASETFRPMTPEELEEARARAHDAMEGKGSCWWNPA